MTCVLPLDEESDGTPNEFVDRTRHHFDGVGGLEPIGEDDLDETTCPTIDNGVFCLPSQHFDGRQVIRLDQDDITGNHDFTVSLWTRVETFGKSRNWYSRGYSDGTNTYVVSFGHSFLNSPQASFHVLSDAGSPIEQISQSSSILTQNTWYHVAMTYGSDTVKLYVNGVLVKTTTLTGDLVDLANGCFLATNGQAASLQGNLQEFKLHPVVRSANWLLAEYESFCDYFITEGTSEGLFYY